MNKFIKRCIDGLIIGIIAGLISGSVIIWYQNNKQYWNVLFHLEREINTTKKYFEDTFVDNINSRNLEVPYDYQIPNKFYLTLNSSELNYLSKCDSENTIKSNYIELEDLREQRDLAVNLFFNEEFRTNENEDKLIYLFSNKIRKIQEGYSSSMEIINKCKESFRFIFFN